MSTNADIASCSRSEDTKEEKGQLDLVPRSERLSRLLIESRIRRFAPRGHFVLLASAALAAEVPLPRTAIQGQDSARQAEDCSKQVWSLLHAGLSSLRKQGNFDVGLVTTEHRRWIFDRTHEDRSTPLRHATSDGASRNKWKSRALEATASEWGATYVGGDR